MSPPSISERALPQWKRRVDGLEVRLRILKVI